MYVFVICNKYSFVWFICFHKSVKITDKLKLLTTFQRKVLFKQLLGFKTHTSIILSISTFSLSLNAECVNVGVIILTLHGFGGGIPQ